MVPRPRTMGRQLPPPLPPPRSSPAVIVLVLALAGCQVGSGSHGVPSVPHMGGDLKCPKSDHPYEDPQAGWGFCYPGSWEHTERAQASHNPPGLELTVHITYPPAIRTARRPAH